MENGINKLCVFFGKQKANDILLSHVITFLNDKDDKELRGSFFECIVGVAAYIGWHSSSILMPLLQQGLSDPEEFVIMKAIHAMATLTELGLLHKSALYQLLLETMVFLVRYCLGIIILYLLRCSHNSAICNSPIGFSLLYYISALYRR